MSRRVLISGSVAYDTIMTLVLGAAVAFIYRGEQR